MDRKCSVFVSYSHKNEDMKNEFERFLIQLNNEGLVDYRHDRLVEIGSPLDEEIKDKIFSSDIVIFLVSQDFLISEYCMQVEVGGSLSRLGAEIDRVVPIILYSCGWLHSPLRRFKAPFDGVAIAEQDNRDKLWNGVCDSLRETIATVMRKKEASRSGLAVPGSRENPVYDRQFVESLDDIGVSLSNGFVQRLSLPQIFVWPELRSTSKRADEIDLITSSKNHISSIGDNSSLILGEVQSGKTSLAKVFCKELISRGKNVLLESGENISDPKPSTLISRLSSIQLSAKKFESSDKLYLIIDNFSEIRLNRKYRAKLLDELAGIGVVVIAFSQPEIRFDESIYGFFSNSSVYELIPLGPSLRDELICNWLSAGREHSIDERARDRDRDQLSHMIDAMVRKTVLPPKPINLLIILQTRESFAPQDPNLSSYGYCYQRLILNTFERAGIKGKQIDSYMNYLAALSYFMYSRDTNKLSDKDLGEFERSYYSEYVSKEKNILEALAASGIIRRSYDGVSFSYLYILYYCVGKFISDNLSSIGSSEVDRLVQGLHVTRNCNVLIFLTHHVRDVAFLSAIIGHIKTIYASKDRASLDSEQVRRLNSIAASIPGVKVEGRGAEDERKDRLSRRDQKERKYLVEKEIDDKDGADLPAHVAEIGKSARAVEVIGQIVRNRFGSIKKGDLQNIADEGVAVGLRFLQFFLAEVQASEEVVLDVITKILDEHYEMSEQELKEAALKTYWGMCFGVAYSVIAKVSKNVASGDLLEVVEAELLRIRGAEKVSPSELLIWTNAKLNFDTQIPVKDIESAAKILEGNPIAYRLLQQVVVEHLRLNNVEHSERQSIMDILRIPVAAQKAITSASAR